MAAQYGDFSYTTNGSSATITGYTGAGGAVTIPATINGLSVTGIGNSAFSRCLSLASVAIPESVTNIGYRAFASCTNLTSVSLPDSVTTLGSEAFIDCRSLASLAIPAGLTSIGDQAFSYCRRLTSVTIPGSVTNIGNMAFLCCTSLGAITVDGLNPAYSSLDGVLLNKSQTTLIEYPGGKAGSYTVPAGVTSIGDAAFEYCSSLTGVTMGTSITNIGDAAFDYCTSLPSVTIPDSVTTIGDYAFHYCTLSSVTLGDSVAIIGNSAFSVCTNLTNLTMPASLTKIGSSAFFQSSSLAAVYFQGNAPSLGGVVFYGATNAIIYYLPATTGWGPTFGGRPTVLWNPQMQTTDSSGFPINGFGFIITASTNLVVVVEACANLATPIWSPVSTNTLAGASSFFRDPQWTNYARRFYRLRSP